MCNSATHGSDRVFNGNTIRNTTICFCVDNSLKPSVFHTLGGVYSTILCMTTVRLTIPHILTVLFRSPLFPWQRIVFCKAFQPSLPSWGQISSSLLCHNFSLLLGFSLRCWLDFTEASRHETRIYLGVIVTLSKIVTCNKQTWDIWWTTSQTQRDIHPRRQALGVWDAVKHLTISLDSVWVETSSSLEKLGKFEKYAYIHTTWICHFGIFSNHLGAILPIQFPVATGFSKEHIYV